MVGTGNDPTKASSASDVLHARGIIDDDSLRACQWFEYLFLRTHGNPRPRGCLGIGTPSRAAIIETRADRLAHASYRAAVSWLSALERGLLIEILVFDRVPGPALLAGFLRALKRLTRNWIDHGMKKGARN